ncbi:hypothetical protein EOT10_07065 [Streptomyces antnestii]|uniref:Uncharacterized protein n=1 Tax=Streptomyces antnestii TaxID=2494256 RepID=A0A437Q0L8_9ACTN|nr:hypothetical protein EOT10_07065 [Streptomyces sp. San01]
MRIPRLRGADGTLLTCPSCRLKCLQAAVGPDGGCPRCGHPELVRVDAVRGADRRAAPGSETRFKGAE